MDKSRLSARRWLHKAAEDLEMAARAMAPPSMAAPVCFHARQAAEKGLKAVAAYMDAPRIPKTHSLIELARLVEGMSAHAPSHVPFPDERLSTLDEYAIEPRYPETPDPTEQDAEEALALAREIYVWAEGICNAHCRRRENTVR